MTDRDTPLAWLGLNHWHLAAFAFCLLLGIAMGAVSAARVDLSDVAFSVMDDVSLGDNHE